MWYKVLALLGASLLIAFNAQAESRLYPNKAVINIGIENLYYPFSFVDNKGERVGFDYDFSQALCRELDISCDIKPLPFVELIPQLLDGRLDIIVAGLGNTKERREMGIAFTRPYYRGQSMYLTIDPFLEKVDAEYIKGKIVASQNSSMQLQALKNNYGKIAKKIVGYDTYPEIVQAILNHEVDLAYIDGLSGYEILKNYEAQEIIMILDESTSLKNEINYACLAMRSTDKEQFSKVDAAVAKLVATNEFQQISLRYFPFVIY